MNFPDYEQTASNHSCLLVLIRGIGVRDLHNFSHFQVHYHQFFNFDCPCVAQQAPNVAENIREDTEGQQCED